MSQRLIAIDMDGTLIDSNKKLPETNKQAIREAQAAGHLVMICSGRPHEPLMDYLAKEGLGDLPVSASNGTCTFVEGRIIDTVAMDHAITGLVVTWLIEQAYPVNLYTNEGVWGHVDFLRNAKREADRFPEPTDAQGHSYTLMAEYTQSTVRKVFTTWADIPATLSVFKLFVYIPDPANKQAFEAYAHTVAGITVTSSYPNNVEISDAQGHKGAGLAAVAKHYGIPMAQTVAIGDNFNDLGMLQVAGLSIAMENAETAIKDMAHVVTLSNDDAGVAYAIRTHVLNAGS